MTTPIRDFSLLVSQREAALVMGKINGTLLSNEGKLVVVIVDNSDWVLRVTLSTDGLKATIVNAQRIHPLLEAAIMVTHVKIDSRVDKARLTIATAGDRSSVHVQKPEFSQAFDDVITSPWRYLAEYDVKKTAMETRRYMAATLGEPTFTEGNGEHTGSLRFEFEGGCPLVCYVSRTLIKAEILSKKNSEVVVTHTRLSRRTGGCHTTHASAIMPLDEALPSAYCSAYRAEAKQYLCEGGTVDLEALLAGGGWTSSAPGNVTPPPVLRQPITSMTPPSSIGLGSPQKKADCGGAHDQCRAHHRVLLQEFPQDGEEEHELDSDFRQFQQGKTTKREREEPKTKRRAKEGVTPDDGKVVVSDETMTFLKGLKKVWYREGPRGRAWLPAVGILSGGPVKVVLDLGGGETKLIDRSRVAYEPP